MNEENPKVFQIASRLKRCKYFEHGPFEVDTSLQNVYCGSCGKELNPIWVLDLLAKREGRAWELWSRVEAIKKDAAMKSKTKCIHCERITPITSRLRS